MNIGLDFETYGSVDLRKHGLDRYVSDPNFTPLIGEMYSADFTASFDFVNNMERDKQRLADRLAGNTLVAQNAPFELAVLKWLGIEHPLDQVIDSAVVARAAGASGHLAGAAPQLLGIDKMEEGMDLIRLFSIPGKYQEANGNMAFDPQVIKDNLDKWKLFKKYCALDGRLCWMLANKWGWFLPAKEYQYTQVTMKMNEVGWPVDLEAVREMQRRYLENQDAALRQFQLNNNAADLNLNSLKQLKEWCADRGIKANSFDEKHVASLVKRIDKKLESMLDNDVKWQGYTEVLDLLLTKQVLGGSSLKKLEVILNTVGDDGRLRDQYLHVGAGQTWRTTGRSVQMQNLKRFTGEPADMSTLFDDDVDWTNDDMAINLRQVFRASDPKGHLLVGDFSSVESRGLAYLAGEEWKLEQYRQKADIYKVLAMKIYGIADVGLVTKTERQTGKVGELSCGYAAGPGAVLEFAKNMGVEMSEGEATKLVYDWRDANPKIVEFWQTLDEMLHRVLNGADQVRHDLKDGFALYVGTSQTPDSLLDQRPDVQSIVVHVTEPGSGPGGDRMFLQRVFHGCHARGRNIGYFKPSDRKTGDLWKDTFVDPKTKQTRHYEIYGGKLAGILTQSFCRELFFQSLLQVHRWVSGFDNVELIGQFHDEIVLDWQPNVATNLGVNLRTARSELEAMMSQPGKAVSFPLAADVKFDYRYTK